MLVKSLSDKVDVRLARAGSMVIIDHFGRGFEVIEPHSSLFSTATMLAVGYVETDGSIRRISDEDYSDDPEDISA